jgi:DNA replication protein DnaC
MARNRRIVPGSDPLEELAQLCIDLDLTALASMLPKMLQDAEQQSPSFTDFALAMLRGELAARLERRLSRGLKRSHLGTVEGLDGFDFSIRPQLEPRIVRELHNGAFVRDKRNVLCLGRPGLGKTRIAKSIAHAACVQGHSVLCVLTAQMLEDLHASRADSSFKRVLRRYTKPDVLVLDEFGYEGFDSDASTYLFRVVSARYGTGSIVLTANTGFKQWKNIFPSEAHAVATIDRLVDRATILRFTGKTKREPLTVTGAPLD